MIFSSCFIIIMVKLMFSLQPNHRADSGWSRLLIHPHGVEGAHDFLGNSANTDLICQAKGERGQAPVPTPTLETNKRLHICGRRANLNVIVRFLQHCRHQQILEQHDRNTAYLKSMHYVYVFYKRKCSKACPAGIGKTLKRKLIDGERKFKVVRQKWWK